MEDSNGTVINTTICKIKSTLSQVSNILNNTSVNSFGELLKEANISESEYNVALKYSVKGNTVINRRNTNEIFVNYYNMPILKAWKANMDIQENSSIIMKLK